MTRLHKPSGRLRGVGRIILTGLVAGSATLGLTALTATPAQAVVRTTDYALSVAGFGSRVIAGQVALASGPTALSVLTCTRSTGLVRSNNIVSTDLNGQVKLGGVTTLEQTITDARQSTIGRSTTTIASATLGSSTLGLRITGLRGVAQVAASKTGVLTASSTFTFTDISPVGALPLPPPLNQPADVILQRLSDQGPITIPGLGRIALGSKHHDVSSGSARAYGYGLYVHLFGSDGINGTADDSDVQLGRTEAQISKKAQNGIFVGGAWGIDAKALNGAVSLGRNPLQGMPCVGTYGRVLTASLAGVDLGSTGQLVVSGLRQRVYGVQNVPKGGLSEYAESVVADVNIGDGQVHLTGIRALAQVVKNSRGRITATPTQTMGALSVAGTPRALPKPGQSIVIPGVAKIEAPLPVRTAIGVHVTALRITLLGGTAASTVVNLGNAEVYTRMK